jgi:hypothetical protein
VGSLGVNKINKRLCGKHIIKASAPDFATGQPDGSQIDKVRRECNWVKLKTV